MGNTIYTQGPTVAVTTAEYDSASNLVREVDALGVSTWHSYDMAGRRTQTTDRVGRVTRTAYDRAERVIETQDRGTDNVLVSEISYGYDSDPFHVVKLANAKVDERRRRDPERDPVTPGPQRRLAVPDPPALDQAHERLDERGDAKLRGLLHAGDPRGEVQMTWHAKETIRQIYDIDDHELACSSSTNSPTTPCPKKSSPSAVP